MLDQARNNVLKLLSKFKPQDEQELKDLAQIRTLVEQHKNIFTRNCLAAHLTGSALVVNPKTKKILLHQHKKLNKWLQFGGHADGETDLAMVAMKEAQEESGLTDLIFYSAEPLDIEVQKIPAKNAVPAHLHLDVRYLVFTQDESLPKPAEHESQALKFIDFSEIDDLTDQLDYTLVRLIKKASKLI